MRIVCAALALVLSGAPHALAQDMPATNRISDRLADGSPIGPAALQRLASIRTAIGRAVPRGLVNGGAGEAAALAEALSGWPLTPDRALAVLAGDWSCRTLHLRHDSAVVLHPATMCRVTSAGGLTIVPGLNGRIHRDDGLLLWLSEGSGDGHQTLGVLQVTDADRARMYLPAPDDRPDSLDLIVMRRVVADPSIP